MSQISNLTVASSRGTVCVKNAAGRIIHGKSVVNENMAGLLTEKSKTGAPLRLIFNHIAEFKNQPPIVGS